MIIVEERKYKLIENFRDAFNDEEFKNLYTEYFYDFDYIVGDYAYNKLRLKGFYKDNNKKSNKMNKFSMKDNYIKDYCAYNCRYFVLEKI